MKFENITVSGITNVVIDRKAKWTLYLSGIWHKQNKDGQKVESDNRTHEQMMSIVAHLKEDRRYRMWVHGDTLNIERK